MPAGLSIGSSTGVISGTIEFDPEQEEPYTVVVTATDSTDQVFASQTFVWSVYGADNLVAIPDPRPRPNWDWRERQLDSQIEILDRQIAIAQVARTEHLEGITIASFNIAANLALISK